MLQEKVQPFGKIPALTDGDYHVYESRAIAIYLASAYDKTGTLYPSDAKLRGLVEQWLSVDYSYFDAAGTLVYELYFKKWYGAPTDDAKVAEADVKLHQVLAVLDKHLTGKTFLVGDNITVAGLCD